MSMEPNIIGYHTNDAKRCQEFLDNGRAIISEDKWYLGCGMYFWDNLANARYWLSEKMRKNKDPLIVEWIIVRANVTLTDMLDLTDDEVLLMVNKLWEMYCAKNRHACNSDPLGKKIDMLFDYFETSVLSVYKIIKAYDKKAKSLEETNEFLKDTRVYNDRKCFYCVRDDSVIFDRELVEVRKNE